MPLCRLLEAQGAKALRLAAVEIKPLGDRRVLAMRLGTLESFDVIIFSIRNATSRSLPSVLQPRGP
jgi:uroporphyrinogen-III synthase